MYSVVIVQVRLTVVLALQIIQLVFGAVRRVIGTMQRKLLLQMRAQVIFGSL